MDLKGKTILVLGGSGEVGFAFARRALKENPRKIVIAALTKEEVEEAKGELSKEFPDTDTEIETEFGNIFVRTPLKDKTRSEILRNPQYRNWIMEDVIGEFTEEILENSFLHQIITKHKPDIIVDSINTATALAYQDVYWSAQEVLGIMERGGQLEDAVSRLITSLYIPQLVRHIQILNQSMRENGVSLYIKVGTTGTGGMGLNIPYTHGEERPSRVLLSKAAVAGAHTLLLFLMARTPGGPIVKEVKPAALIGWRGIGFGSIKKRGREVIKLLDCLPEKAYELNEGSIFNFREEKWGEELGKPLESVFIDTGENGVFTPDEFKAITTLGQMQYITPEEIAEVLMMEIRGANTSKDVIDALDGSVMGATYRAGLLREFAIKRMELLMEKEGKYSPAFEILGPPRLSKLLFEAEILKRCCGTMEKVLSKTPEELSKNADELIMRDDDLRRRAISIGIPILLSDGKHLLFSSLKRPEKRWEREPWEVKSDQIEHWAQSEWIDLREKNMRFWKNVFESILREEEKTKGTTSSLYDRGQDFWKKTEEGEHIIDPGEVVGWIFLEVEDGYKLKP